MCIYFDYVGQVVCEEFVKFIVCFVKKYVDVIVQEGEEFIFVFLGGDLNIIFDNFVYFEMIVEGNFDDVCDVIDEFCIYGYWGIFIGFDWNGEDQLNCIDYIFCWRQVCDLDFLMYGVIENRFDDGFWILDYRVIVVDFYFEVNKMCVFCC